MRIDPASFFILAGTLAAGGAGGWYASQKNVLGLRPDVQPQKDPVPAAPAPSASAAAIATAPPPTASTSARPADLPACMDDVGTPGACPPPGYSAEEGGCGYTPVKKCTDYKAAFKPKVAENAVACLNSLKWNERCDPLRLHLCGHLALMNACVDPREAEGADTASAPGTPGRLCEAIVGECKSAPLKPTLQECRAILSGMSDKGRNAMVACMKTHCSDKGLLDCEAVLDAN